MTDFSASVDIPVKSMGTSITVMGEIMEKEIQYQIEGGGMNLSQKQAEDIAHAILRCIRKTRSVYHKIHGKKAP